jgi:hypothetical protein
MTCNVEVNTAGFPKTIFLAHFIIYYPLLGNKGKILHVTCHAGTSGTCSYSSTLSLSSAIDRCRRSKSRRDRFTPGKVLWYSILQEAVSTPGPVWMGVGKGKPLASTGVGTPNLPGHRKSLYRLRYPISLRNNTRYSSVFLFALQVHFLLRFISHVYWLSCCSSTQTVLL